MDEILAIKTEEAARAVFDQHVADLRPHFESDERAVDVARMNIGWCFGEGMDSDTKAMWRIACGAYHPVFGEMREWIAPEDAYEAGLRFSKLQGTSEERSQQIRRGFTLPTAWDRLSRDDDE